MMIGIWFFGYWNLPAPLDNAHKWYILFLFSINSFASMF